MRPVCAGTKWRLPQGVANRRFEPVPSPSVMDTSVVTGGGLRSIEFPQAQWLNTVLWSVKNAMQCTYHQASGKDPSRYLGAFCYHLNCRLDFAVMLSRLGVAASRALTTPNRLLVLSRACTQVNPGECQ